MSVLTFLDGNGNLQNVGTAEPLPVANAPSAAASGGNAGAVTGAADATDTTSTSLIGAITNRSIYLTGWAFSNSGATTVTVTFQDGSGGSQIGPKITVPAGGGNNMSPGGPSWGKTTAGNALYFAAAGSTSTLHGGAVGFAQ